MYLKQILTIFIDGCCVPNFTAIIFCFGIAANRILNACGKLRILNNLPPVLSVH